MLNIDAYKNIEIIRSTAQKVWGADCILGEVKVIEAPFAEFEMPMRLYDKFDIRLEYERSTLGIMVCTPEGYIGLSRLADEHVFRGFESCVPENMLHNFTVLNRLLLKDQL